MHYIGFEVPREMSESIPMDALPQQGLVPDKADFLETITVLPTFKLDWLVWLEDPEGLEVSNG